MEPVSTALAAASIAQGLFGQGGLLGKKRKMPKYVAPDISGELAKLDALYAQQGELLKQGVQQQIAGAQRQTAQGLANRGIYSSPVSQKALNEVQRQGLLALSTGQAGLLGQQAQARSAALNNLMQYQQAAQRANNEIAMQRYAAQKQGAMQMLGTGAGLLANQFGAGQQRQPNQIDPMYTNRLNQYFGGGNGLDLYGFGG